MSETLLAPTFLFRFSTACRYRKSLWAEKGIKLGEEFVLPSFGELEGKHLFADLRAAWSEEGLAFVLEVVGKKQTPWCRATRIDDSDGLQLWIDTRNAHNIHRASRFCHRFAFLPFGGGQRLDQPVAELLPINRAKANPKAVTPGTLRVAARRRSGGYLLHAFVPAAAMTGFDPQEHMQLGFTYAIIDRELGFQTLSVGPEFPFVEDPSLWGTLELSKS
jgi:hypothetical protein